MALGSRVHGAESEQGMCRGPRLWSQILARPAQSFAENYLQGGKGFPARIASAASVSLPSTFQMPLFSRGEIACARTRPVEFGFCRLEARPSIQIRARSEPSRMASSHPLTYDESGKAPSRRALDYVSPSRQRSIFRFDPPRLGVKGAASIAARGLSQHFQRDGAG